VICVKLWRLYSIVGVPDDPTGVLSTATVGLHNTVPEVNLSQLVVSHNHAEEGE